MSNFYQDYIYFDSASLVQISATVGAAIVSFIALKKDLRARTKELQKEARTIQPIIFILTGLSILNIFVSGYNSHNEKKALDDSLSKLITANGKLRNTLDSNSIKQSNLITSNQKESARELKDAADNLHDLINGSTEPPLFHFVLIEDSTFSGGFYKTDKFKSIYNLTVGIMNIDCIKKCKTNSTIYKYKITDLSCYNSCVVSLGTFPVINNNWDIPIDLPQYTPGANFGRYIVTFTMNSGTYEEEAIYKFKNRHLLQALRILLVNGNKIISIKYVKRKDFSLNDVDWNKEFPSDYLKSYHLQQVK